MDLGLLSMQRLRYFACSYIASGNKRIASIAGIAYRSKLDKIVFTMQTD